MEHNEISRRGVVAGAAAMGALAAVGTGMATGASAANPVLKAGSRGPSVTDVALARGPGNLGQALGTVLGEDDGTSLLDGSGPFRLTLAPGLEARLTTADPADVVAELLRETVAGPAGAAPVRRISVGPRTGVAGVAGGATFPWRSWWTGDPTVSAYRRHRRAID